PGESVTESTERSFSTPGGAPRRRGLLVATTFNREDAKDAKKCGKTRSADGADVRRFNLNLRKSAQSVDRLSLALPPGRSTHRGNAIARTSGSDQVYQNLHQGVVLRVLADRTKRTPRRSPHASAKARIRRTIVSSDSPARRWASCPRA